MALFGRTTIDDPALMKLVGGRRVLASGRSPVGQVLGLADALAYTDGAACHEVAWHDVDRGGWDHASRMLRWTTVDGRSASLELIETGRLPDLFNERVTASIACVRTVTLADRGTAVITARRNWADPTSALIWRVAPGKGIQSEDVLRDPLVALELERLRAEYDVR